MRITRMSPGLLILAAGLVGCSQPLGIRSGSSTGVRTVASVGDKPYPIVSGEPGASVRAGAATPETPAASRGRISGRVFDEQGKPVSNARVRLAISGEAGGKALHSTTDRSGAFTLKGLRPGSTYTVVAEYQGEKGIMSGRADAEAPDANVRISLRSRDSGLDEPRTSVRPARPAVEPVSNTEALDDDSESEASPPLLNREDVEPPAPEAELLQEDEESYSPRGPVSRDRAARNTGWSRQGPLTPERRPGPQEKANERPPYRRETPGPDSDPRALDLDEDGPNPLPPALEPEPEPEPENQTSSEPTGQEARSVERPVRIARTDEPPFSSARPSPRRNDLPEPLEAEETAGNSSPRPLPAAVLPGARSVRPKSYGPISLPDSPLSGGKTSRGPQRQFQIDDGSANGSGKRNEPAAKSRPTWGDLSQQEPRIPLDESILRTSRDAQTRPPQLTTTEKPTTEPVKSASPAAGRSTAVPTRTGPFCNYDHTERRLHDFQLPSVNGRMMSFRDFDADLILLDFWGTWCGPCRTSIPHLAQIQAALGGKRVKVVGIACERVPAKDRAAKVTKTIQELGINYPVLLSGMDGTCPVQEAMQIQFYPTMILVDRDGKILCREQGATEVTLGRLDRVIANALKSTASSSRDF